MDVVQETLLRIWVRGWLPPEPAAALTSLVRRSCLHQLRCDSRRSTRERVFAQERAEPCCSEDPRAVLERGENSAMIQAAVQRVAHDYRVVFELYEFEGESYEEIGTRLGMPVGTVRSRLSRARRLLRTELERQGWAA